MIYTDILLFHREALKCFKRSSQFICPIHVCIGNAEVIDLASVWKQLFSATWRGFVSRINSLVENMKRHQQLIESRANVMQLQEMKALRQKSDDEFASIAKAEDDRRRDIVRQWLAGFSNEKEQDRCRRLRKDCPGSGRWLIQSNRFQEWYSLSNWSTPVLWLTGIPGAGKISNH